MTQKIIFTTAFCFFIIGSAFSQVKSDRDIPLLLKDQQILDDLIVDGSECVGQDCVNGESFGFDTQRYKENNLRIHFHDTSTSASFPSTDWRIIINDSSNGGGNYFAVQDATASRIPFRIEGSAPDHSLYVDDGGRVGIGTSTPVADVHTQSGNTPTVRLQQDGSSGFTAQTWDLAGNEANFFIRDATSGSTLPFRLFPGAPSNALCIEGSTGDIGIGLTSPTADMHIRSNTGTLTIENTTEAGAEDDLYYTGGKLGLGTDSPLAKLTITEASASAIVRVERPDFGATGSNLQFHAAAGDPQIRFERNGDKWAMGNDAGTFAIDRADNVSGTGTGFYMQTDGDVGIGETSPTQKLHVAGNAFKTSGGNTWAVPSDKRLKNNIKEYKDGLKQVLQINPVEFRYNDEFGFNPKENVVGVVAQEMQKIAPYMVYDLDLVETETNANGENIVRKKGTYLGYQGNALQYMLVNAIKDQQVQIEDLKSQVEDLTEIKNEFEALKEKMEMFLENNNAKDVLLTGSGQAFLGQNVPNPYNSKTKIEYVLPENFRTAKIQFNDVNGNVIKTVELHESGQVDLEARDMPNGNYSYSLIVDGKIVDTKKMVLVK